MINPRSANRLCEKPLPKYPISAILLTHFQSHKNHGGGQPRYCRHNSKRTGGRRCPGGKLARLIIPNRFRYATLDKHLRNLLYYLKFLEFLYNSIIILISFATSLIIYLP